MKLTARLFIAVLSGALLLGACGTAPSGHQVEASTGATTTSSGSPSSTAAQSSASSAPSTSGATIASTTTLASSTATDVVPSTRPGFPPEQASGAVEIILTSTDLTAIGKAYAHFVKFTDCVVTPVSGQMQAALITATGVKWAFGPLQPAAGCTLIRSGSPVSPYLTYPFKGVTSKAVFTEQPGATWTVNWFESDPFPCPADLSLPLQSPGRGTPFVPLAVLRSVGVPWSNSPKCNTALQYIPDPPGGP